jgi:hypothetical protein
MRLLYDLRHRGSIARFLDTRNIFVIFDLRETARNVGLEAAQKRPNVRLKGSIYPPNVRLKGCVFVGYSPPGVRDFDAMAAENYPNQSEGLQRITQKARFWVQNRPQNTLG